MHLKLIDQKSSAPSVEKLKEYYQRGTLVPDKKEYLTQHKVSVGPYLGLLGEDGEYRYMFDAASQIATLGLGFNPSVFFSAATPQEAWSNRFDTPLAHEWREAFDRFFARKLGVKKIYSRIVNSGAEANETALGFCYHRRAHESAKKVLAFEGSFHGRMQISLSSTWNPSKREPFEWEDFLTSYVSYPDIKDAQVKREIPDGWQAHWQQATQKEFTPKNFGLKDEDLQREVASLMQVRSLLLSGEIFAVIIEPMQCEGGDRYSSDRFHHALWNMCRSFQIPLVIDEVQTGMHLGRRFFWHREFEVVDHLGRAMVPDYIVCAKKAQVGAVFSDRPLNDLSIEDQEEFNLASMIRGLAHGLTLDQRHQEIIKLEKMTADYLQQFCKRFQKFVEYPRLRGMAFSFDLKDKEHVAQFIAQRFDHGLLYYPAGDQTLRFRLNLAVKENELNFLFHQLECIAELVFLKENKLQKKTEVEWKGVSSERNYELHKWLLDLKIEALNGQLNLKKNAVMDELHSLFRVPENYRMIRLDHQSYAQYADAIHRLQKEVYEPGRQTEIEKFAKIAEHKQGIAIALLDKDQLVGTAFASPLSEHPLERGVRRDDDFEDQDALYMLDVTLNPQHGGKGLGKFLKVSLYALALVDGRKVIKGRNRDRLAWQMLEINLSLGALEQMYLEEDYPDFETHRDALYYKQPLTWEALALNLSSRSFSFEESIVGDREFIHEYLDAQVNKVCLSNFVNERYLQNFEDLMSFFPQNLRQGYSASGQSECVDKVVKSLWLQRKPHQKLLSFEECYFGSGSFLSRTLSYNCDDFFPVDRVSYPTLENWRTVLSEIEKNLKLNSYLGIFIEPVTQKFMKRAPLEFLQGLKKLAESHQTPLVFNETTSVGHRYDSDHFSASDLVEPDVCFAHLGGQAAVVCLQKKYFVSTPLMMISTWDGDEVCLASAVDGFKKLKNKEKNYLQTLSNFESKLKEKLSVFGVEELELKNGVGYIKGDLPLAWQELFLSPRPRTYLINPTWSQMQQFLKEH